MAKMNSPLHRVIDARRWDGELLLGRLFILFHAAFVDAGFLPAAAADPFLPKQLGATASTLSLRYLVPLQQLLAAVALRVRAYGRHVVFYVGPFYVDTSSVVSGAGSSDYLWACVDAFAAAPFLSGGLDGTARALRNDPLVAALWRELAQGLSCRVLREICGGEHELYHLLSPPPPPPWTYEYDPPELFLSAAATKYLDGLAEAERLRGKAGARRAMSWSSSGGGREKRRHHAGAVNSPSARYRWKHR
ncbi:hypothetical protein BRADI_4g04525v3 [Brachypodium distachyon]|uniref:Uncharacterized protein n=1 Tax=Brachypodium distachyon TaxID=15368 RepID=A0A0Q3GZC4_BRADI|nr:hypothetical protein BRADI_4g04525v3 [Brachypodium distachyon]